MSMKERFKATDIGLIPIEWEVHKLANVTERISVGLATSVTKFYRACGTPIIRNLNIKDGFFDPSDMLYLEPAFAKQNASKAARAFDVLTVHTGSNLGLTCVLPADFDGCQTFTTLITTANARVLNPLFLARVMSSNYGKSEMARLQVGGGKGNLNTADLKRFRIAFPPTLAEQEMIAKALSDADAWIESLEQLIAKKRQIKQGAMHELLTGKRRLPSFSGNWMVKRLGELGRCERGVSYNPATDLYPCDNPRSVRLLRSNNVQDAAVILTDLQFVDADRVSKEQYLQEGDILVCMANGSRDLVGKAGLFRNGSDGPYSFGAFMGGFRPITELADPTFVFYLFQTSLYRHHIGVLLAGSSINNLTPASLEAFSVKVPDDQREQAAIGEVLSDLDKEIDQLDSKLKKAYKIKQAMMQELLTGRIRLVEPTRLPVDMQEAAHA